MRKIVLPLVGCLLLTGCGATWEDQLRYKIVEVDRSTPTEMLRLELVGDVPKDALTQDGVASKFVYESDISGGAVVGDEIVCKATQERGHAFKYNSMTTKLSGCKKA